MTESTKSKYSNVRKQATWPWRVYAIRFKCDWRYWKRNLIENPWEDNLECSVCIQPNNRSKKTIDFCKRIFAWIGANTWLQCDETVYEVALAGHDAPEE